MKEVEIKLTGIQNLENVLLYVDDEPLKFKKNEFGNVICKYKTENDKINIKVSKILDVGGAIWFITQLLFFLISVFGIFDIHKKENCIIIDFEMEVKLQEENKIILQFNNQKENEKAINIQTDLQNQEICNKYYLNNKAKRTIKVLKITKIFLTIVIIIVAILILTKLF